MIGLGSCFVVMTEEEILQMHTFLECLILLLSLYSNTDNNYYKFSSTLVNTYLPIVLILWGQSRIWLSKPPKIRMSRFSRFSASNYSFFKVLSRRHKSVFFQVFFSAKLIRNWPSRSELFVWMACGFQFRVQSTIDLLQSSFSQWLYLKHLICSRRLEQW